MMAAPPIPCAWIDGAFRPLPRFHNVAAAHYGEGEIVSLQPYEERSDVSHRHEFAWLQDAWLSLPESMQDEFPNKEALRKWALIKGGFCTEQRIDVGSNAGAVRVAQAIRSFPGEEYTAVVVRGPLVVVRRAKSQARGKMEKAEFQASKTAIIDAVSELLGVTPEALGQARAA